MTVLTFILFALLHIPAPCTAGLPSGTTIVFSNYVGNKPLILFDETYINPFNEPFSVSKFRYYISHISYLEATGKADSLPDNYYLINQEDSSSLSIQLPASGITQLSFLIGVDSARNVSGVQTGSLDPANTMFWTWNSGYVFAKLEGRSDSSHAPVHTLSWHAGGFRQQENALRTVKLMVTKQHSDIIHIRADVLKWFDGAHSLHIAVSPVCHQPGQLAVQLADNYSKMFSVIP